MFLLGLVWCLFRLCFEHVLNMFRSSLCQWLDDSGVSRCILLDFRAWSPRVANAPLGAMKLHSERTLQRNRYAAKRTRERMTPAFCPSDAGFLTDSGCGSFARQKHHHAALPLSAVRYIRPGVRIWSGGRSAPRNPKQDPSFRPVGPEVPQHPCMGSTGLAEFGLSP